MPKGMTRNSGTLGNIKSEYTDTFTNPYFPEGAGKTTGTNFSNADFTTVKCCVGLHTGVFSGKIFPVLMSNGLYMEFDLQPSARVIKQLDTASGNRKLQLNPVFHSLNGSIDAPNTWADSANASKVYVDTKNNLQGDDAVNAFPFVVGESIGWIDATDDTEGDKADLSAQAVISEINACATNELLEVIFNEVTNNTGADIGPLNYDATPANYTALGTLHDPTKPDVRDLNIQTFGDQGITGLLNMTGAKRSAGTADEVHWYEEGRNLTLIYICEPTRPY